MIEIIASVEGMKPIEEDWNRLANLHGDPLLDYDWFMAAVRSLHTSDSLFIITYRTEGKLCAIAPLIKSNNNWVKQLEIIGTRRLTEPSGFLYENNESLRALCTHIIQLNIPFALQRVLRNSEVVDIIQFLSVGKGKLFTLSATGAPFVKIKGDWESYFSSLSSRRRYDFRRARKKLSSNKEVEFVMLKPEPGQVNDIYNRFMTVESANWKGRAHSSLTHSVELREFFKQYLLDMSSKGLSRFGFLDVGEESVSAVLGLEYKNRFWVLKIGYDEKWSASSPGIQLIMETIKYSFDNKLDQFEFLGSDESWLKIWTNQGHTYSTLIYYPYSISGAALLCQDMLRSFINKLFK